MKRLYYIPIMIGLAALVSGCPPKKPGTPWWLLLMGGGNTPTMTYTISGTVIGLGAGDSVSLTLNGSETLPVTSNTGFTFATRLATGDSYSVQVASASGTVCAASSNTGTIASASVNNVSVTCSEITHTVSVNVTGLPGGDTVVFQNNGADDLTVTANGTATFATRLPLAAGYNVLVLTQPATGSIKCTPSQNTGSISGNVTVNVLCATAYTISGTINGLAGSGLVLRLNNTGEPVTKNAGDTTFSFPTQVANGTAYAVTVATNPTSLDQTCSVGSTGSGTVSGANVSSIVVNCTNNPFTISGTVTGLTSGDSVQLQLNSTDDKSATYDHPGFSWSKPDGFTWSVGVLTSAHGKTCAPSFHGSGTLASANVTDVVVHCALNQYTVSGGVSGLCSGQSITVRNTDYNGTHDVIVSGATPAFTFPLQNHNTSYAVSVVSGSAPTGVTCTVTGGGSGTIDAANVTGAQVTCTGCNSCNGAGALTVTWQASRSYDVKTASGGGHKIYYQTSTGVTKATTNVVDVPNTDGTPTSRAIPGLKRGCTYYVKVGGYSAINPTGGNLSSELSRTVP